MIENFRSIMTPLLGNYPDKCVVNGIGCYFIYKGRNPNPYGKPEHFAIGEMVTVEGRLVVLKKGKGQQHDHYYIVEGYDKPVHCSTLRELYGSEIASIVRDLKITKLLE